MSDGEPKLTVLGHIVELRNRLIKSVIAIAVGSIVCFIFRDYIVNILKLPSGGVDLQFIEMTEMMGTYMRISLFGGIALAMPYLVYHAIMFVSPALTRREKNYVYVILPWIALMFMGGVLFGYFILVPPATKFLLTFGSNVATPQIRVGNYIAIVTRLLLAIGLVFEMPVVTTFLARIGIVKAKWLADKRKIAIVFAFILAAIITPTFDPINQSLVALPLVVLYEISILLAKLVQRKEADTVESVPPPDSQP
ncbi:twin-arginine translocase subunit TatC [Chloroflexota bacterium]